MKEESLLLLSDLQKLINQVVLIDYTIIILGGKTMRNSKTNELVLTGLFTAIIIIMAFTPLGYIPLVVINATIIHIPVILGSLFCGPKKGAFLGFVFGFTSCLKATIVGV